MSKHTPGPYMAMPLVTGHGLPYTPVVAKTLIAKVYSTAYGDHAQSQANACLIAAAPDLLAALQGLDEAYCRAGTPLTRDERTEDRKRLIAARAAIAKATGQQGGAA